MTGAANEVPPLWEAATHTSADVSYAMRSSVPLGLTPIHGLSAHGWPDTSIGVLHVAAWFVDLLNIMSLPFMNVA